MAVPILSGIQDFINSFTQPADFKFNYNQGDTPVQQVAQSMTPVQNQTPQPTPSPQPTIPPQMSDQQLADKIQSGFRKYSGGKPVPMEQYIPQMVQAVKQYPIFQKNPYLIPATSIVETSAGQNWQEQHNPISWGVRVTHEGGGYNPTSAQQAITDMASAVGGDPNRGAGFDPETAKSRMQTASYYDKFRQSNNLADFAGQYDSGNSKYLPALQDALKNLQ